MDGTRLQMGVLAEGWMDGQCVLVRARDAGVQMCSVKDGVVGG